MPSHSQNYFWKTVQPHGNMMPDGKRMSASFRRTDPAAYPLRDQVVSWTES